MYTYRTNFELTDYVNDFEAARDYLKEKDMQEYLSNKEIKRKIESITWHLVNEHQGYIQVISKVKLTEDELEYLSNYISGQNSDGLGEGFEQQYFALNEMDNEDCRWESDYEDDDFYEEYYEDNYSVASFDWKTNEYKLALVEE